VAWWHGVPEIRQSASLFACRLCQGGWSAAGVGKVAVDRGAANAKGLGDRRHRVLPTGMHLPSHLKLVDSHD
jgi:hypothetical protein